MSLFAAFTALVALSPLAAAPLTKWDPDKQARDAQEELDEIQSRIKAGELPKIEFDLNSAKLRESAYEVLDLVAGVLRRNPRLKLRITAHTCIIGTRDYNMKLSRARAKAVKEALVRLGIPPPSIRYVGRGPDDPIADNRSEEGRERNRRVEFHIVKRDWSSIY